MKVLKLEPNNVAEKPIIMRDSAPTVRSHNKAAASVLFSKIFHNE